MLFDSPLHPIAVHFPIALGILIPFLALILMWAIRKGWLAGRSWSMIVLLAGIYFVSALVAAELGENDEDLVEQVVAEEVFEQHEEAGEKVPWAAGILFAVSIVPLLTRDPLRLQIVVAVVGLVGAFFVFKAGHSGGALVYKYGAAEVHMPKVPPPVDE